MNKSIYEDNVILPEDIEYGAGLNTNKIKLIKNSKGYQWEITLLSLDTNKLDNINEEMKVKFGVSKNE